MEEMTEAFSGGGGAGAVICNWGKLVFVDAGSGSEGPLFCVAFTAGFSGCLNS
jgi:hypothetical protein